MRYDRGSQNQDLNGRLGTITAPSSPDPHDWLHLFADRGKGDKHLEDGSYRYLFCTYVSRVTCHMATRLNGRDGFGTFQRGRIHVSIDIFNLNSFLFRRWETIIVFLPSRGLLWGFNIYAVYVFPNMNMHNLAP